VERGLTLFLTGDNNGDDPDNRMGKERSHDTGEFKENPWGTRAREYVATTIKLRDDHWESIEEHALVYMPLAAEQTGMDGSANMGIDSTSMRTQIQLDW